MGCLELSNVTSKLLKIYLIKKLVRYNGRLGGAKGMSRASENNVI